VVQHKRANGLASQVSGSANFQKPLHLPKFYLGFRLGNEVTPSFPKRESIEGPDLLPTKRLDSDGPIYSPSYFKKVPCMRAGILIR